MSISDTITQRGFRKWYEGELVRSHVHLVLLLLSTVAALGALEAFSEQHGPDRLLMVASLAVAAAVGAWALRRYLFHLLRAEQIANQASCSECRAYGRWRIEDTAGEPDTERAPAALAVCCRACGHRWRIQW